MIAWQILVIWVAGTSCGVPKIIGHALPHMALGSHVNCPSSGENPTSTASSLVTTDIFTVLSRSFHVTGVLILPAKEKKLITQGKAIEPSINSHVLFVKVVLVEKCLDWTILSSSVISICAVYHSLEPSPRLHPSRRCRQSCLEERAVQVDSGRHRWPLKVSRWV